MLVDSEPYANIDFIIIDSRALIKFNNLGAEACPLVGEEGW